MVALAIIHGILGMLINHGPIRAIPLAGAMATITDIIIEEVEITIEIIITMAITSIMQTIQTMDITEEIQSILQAEAEVEIMAEIQQIAFLARREEKNQVLL